MEKIITKKEYLNVYTGVFGKNEDEWFKLGRSTIPVGTTLYRLEDYEDGNSRYIDSPEIKEETRSYDFLI